MKKPILVIAAAIMSASVVGCKSFPTADTTYQTSYAIGIATGMVANQTKIDDASRNAIVEVLNIAVYCVPEVDQSFTDAWTPIAKAHVAKLVADGKLGDHEADLVLTAFSLVTKGIDYLFEVRFPEARQYKNLTAAAIDGFSSGFLTIFRPSPSNGIKTEAFDKEAYEYVKDVE